MDPVMNIIAVHHDDPQSVQERMSALGFYISKVCDPSALRFVVMPHVGKDSIDEMIASLITVVGQQ
jgi:tyrosine decarboxylase/aspartate 1-decarboxylase